MPGVPSSLERVCIPNCRLDLIFDQFPYTALLNFAVPRRIVMSYHFSSVGAAFSVRATFLILLCDLQSKSASSRPKTSSTSSFSTSSSSTIRPHEMAQAFKQIEASELSEGKVATQRLQAARAGGENAGKGLLRNRVSAVICRNNTMQAIYVTRRI